jgi:hypothetical protein
MSPGILKKLWIFVKSRPLFERTAPFEKCANEFMNDPEMLIYEGGDRWIFDEGSVDNRSNKPGDSPQFRIRGRTGYMGYLKARKASASTTL